MGLRSWATAESVTNFVAAARQFVKDTGFREFFEKHRLLYETAESRMKTLMQTKGQLEWFDAYFGERPQATFSLALGLLNGGSCYGPHFRDDELSDVLSEYEAHRDAYPALESFAPRLVSFFKQYAADFPGKQAALESKRPKVVSMLPANGAADVNPGLTEIRVTFDRAMKDRSWSMCGGGPRFPQGTGKPYYNEARTTWTVPVRLKPEWDYKFSLNCETYDGFRSEEGTPLEPMLVNFRTASGETRTEK